MICLTVFVVLLSVYSALGVPLNSGHIVGGQNADKDEYPWQIMLKYDGDFYCGGSIINNRTILTAAHCVIDDPRQRWGQFSVTAGEYDSSRNEGTEQTINVKKVKMHKRYDDYTLLNDIAILILESPLDFTSSVTPVPALADRQFDKQAINNENCAVSGWGRFNDRNDQIPDIMQELAPTDVVGNRACNRAMSSTGLKVNQKMICAIDQNSGVCNGDSGGPMGCYDDNGDFTQVGVVSWGPSNKCAKGIQVYTRVSRYLRWIKTNSA